MNEEWIILPEGEAYSAAEAAGQIMQLRLALARVTANADEWAARCAANKRRVLALERDSDWLRQQLASRGGCNSFPLGEFLNQRCGTCGAKRATEEDMKRAHDRRLPDETQLWEAALCWAHTPDGPHSVKA